MMRYRFIGIDLDGTLLDVNSQVSEANRRAIVRAVEAGAMVVPCTGRGWHQALPLLTDVMGLDMGIFVGGAIVGNIATGEILDLEIIEADLVMEIVQVLREEPEAVMVLQEAGRAGRDYLLTGNGEMIDGTQRWLDKYHSRLEIKRQAGIEDFGHTLRVEMRVMESRVKPLQALVRKALGERVEMYSVSTASRCNGETIAKLDIFAAGGHKWRGIMSLAKRHGISAEAIATIGDDFNDLEMLRNAGCGVAMGNAVDEARAAARYVTGSHREDGVALAIEKMLAGEW